MPALPSGAFRQQGLAEGVLPSVFSSGSFESPWSVVPIAPRTSNPSLRAINAGILTILRGHLQTVTTQKDVRCILTVSHLHLLQHLVAL